MLGFKGSIIEFMRCYISEEYRPLTGVSTGLSQHFPIIISDCEFSLLKVSFVSFTEKVFLSSDTY